MSAMVSKNFAIAFWLVPAMPAREFFNDIIRRLAKQYEAPLFEPHLTLHVGPDSTEDARAVLERLPTKQIKLRLFGIQFSDEFTKTLFVKFAPSNDFEVLIDSFGAAGDHSSDPHVSLLYKKLPTQTKTQIASSIAVPFSEVRFDAIKAVHCPNPTETCAEVESWKVIGSKNLPSDGEDNEHENLRPARRSDT